MKRKPDPKRSAAAKKGWETRRRRERMAQRLKRSLAVRKSAAKKRVEQPATSREKELEAKIAQLEVQLLEQKQLNQRMQENVKELKQRIKRVKKPYVVELSQRVAKDYEAAQKAVAENIEYKMSQGWEFYTALYDTWEELNMVEGFDDIADVREAWENEGVSPEAE